MGMPLSEIAASTKLGPAGLKALRDVTRLGIRLGTLDDKVADVRERLGTVDGSIFKLELEQIRRR
jgi:hypothetical protein